MANYTTQTKIENFLQRSLNASEIAYLDTILPAIDRWINQVLGSNFATAAETSRYFDGGGQVIDIDPCQAISEVAIVDYELENNDVLTSNTNFIAEPVNETVKNHLIRRGNCTRFPEGVANIKVTAKFTEYDFVNSAVPADIISIATMLAAGVLNQGMNASSGGNIQSEELEGHKVNYSTADDNLAGIALANPTIQGLLDARKEALVG